MFSNKDLQSAYAKFQARKKLKDTINLQDQKETIRESDQNLSRFIYESLLTHQQIMASDTDSTV